MERRPTGQIKVLVAEDNEVNQLLIHTLLESEGWLITIVENGVECLEKLANEEFSFVLMDIQMPVMGGLEATMKIRNELKLVVPIIGTSANADREDELKSLSAGMNSHMSKFFTMDQLKEIVGEWIK